MVDERLARHLNQWFGNGVRQRPHARAKPRGKNHGFVGQIFWHPGAGLLQGAPAKILGKCSSYQFWSSSTTW
jgi:hypothetical protein